MIYRNPINPDVLRWVGAISPALRERYEERLSIMCEGIEPTIETEARAMLSTLKAVAAERTTKTNSQS